MGAQAVKPSCPTVVISAVLCFASGVGSHLLYVRWTADQSATVGQQFSPAQQVSSLPPQAPQSHRVAFLPLNTPPESAADLPVLAAREVEKIRSLTGNSARIRGRVFKVGHSSKSNTYFLNFGPAREALTAVIFASAVELFEKKKLPPPGFDGKEVEIQGVVKDHPQYGLEVILETPAQIKIVQ
jgi:hypothetical protein